MIPSHAGCLATLWQDAHPPHGGAAGGSGPIQSVGSADLANPSRMRSVGVDTPNGAGSTGSYRGAQCAYCLRPVALKRFTSRSCAPRTHTSATHRSSCSGSNPMTDGAGRALDQQHSALDASWYRARDTQPLAAPTINSSSCGSGLSLPACATTASNRASEFARLSRAARQSGTQALKVPTCGSP